MSSSSTIPVIFPARAGCNLLTRGKICSPRVCFCACGGRVFNISMVSGGKVGCDAAAAFSKALTVGCNFSCGGPGIVPHCGSAGRQPKGHPRYCDAPGSVGRPRPPLRWVGCELACAGGDGHCGVLLCEWTNMLHARVRVRVGVTACACAGVNTRLQ